MSNPSASVAETSPTTARDRLARALELHRAGDLAAAGRAYEDLLAADPENTDALHLLGLVRHAGGDGREAHALLARAVARSPSPRHLANLAMVQGSLGLHDAAIETCRRALAARPDYPEALNTMGVAMAAVERLAPALAAYDRAVELRDDYAEAHFNRGNVLAALWRHRDAERAFVRAFALRPAWNPPRARPRALFVAVDTDAPGHVYRCRRMAEAAAASGWQADVARLADVTDAHLRGGGVVVFWRVELSADVCRMIAFARAGGARVGLDLDDLIVVPALARLEVVDGIRTIGSTEAAVHQHFTRMRQMLEAVDFATCTTEELARHLRRSQKPVWVLPNGFDAATWRDSRRAVRARAAAPPDGLLRIGYASGTRTHQRDLAVAAVALARVLDARPDTQLVLFREASTGIGLVFLDEFPGLAARADRIEWRDMVPLAALPAELARFDINIAPLEPDNPFVEAKSELKYFEAALASVPTIASPTGPFRRAIRHGDTGLLAEGDAGWEAALLRLVDDPAERARLAAAAYHDALWRFGPRAREDLVPRVLAQIAGGHAAVEDFARGLAPRSAPAVVVPAAETLFHHDSGGDGIVTITVASFNYAQYLAEALDSVAAQGLGAIDLVVVDDGSSDESVAVARAWLAGRAIRFNRAGLLATRANAGLGGNRNAGFAWAETPWVMPLDADNRLLPDCAQRLLAAAEGARAAFAYPALRHFGASARVLPALPFEPQRLVGGNYIDAMALVAKWAWAAAGGYYVDRSRMGWEDYDLWCSLAERGLHGAPVDEVLAEYRVHARAMSETMVEIAGHKQAVVDLLEQRHPWLDILSREADPRGGRR